MRKIITILCTLIFTINLSANAAMISVNEDSLIFTESKEYEGTIENKNNEEIYENHEIKQNNSNELISDSEIEKVDEKILSYDESNNITTEDKNFIMQEQQDEFEEEEGLLFNIPTDGKITLQPNKTYEFINSSDKMVGLCNYNEQGMRCHILSYDKDGNRVDSDVYGRGSFSIEPNGKTKIKIISEMELNLEIDSKHIDSIRLKELNTPVFEEIILEKDKRYELTNDTVHELNIENDIDDTLKFNYITFKEGESRQRVLNSKYIYRIEAGRTILLEVDKKSTSESKLYIPYEYKNKLKISDGKVFNKFKMEKNRSYTIENNSNSSKEIYFYQEDSKDYKYDFVDYNENGESIEIGIDKEPSMNRFVYGNRTEKITFSEDVYLYTLYEDLLDIKRVNTPVAYRIELITGQSYELTNKSSNEIAITRLKSNTEDSKYDMVKYNEEGKVEDIHYNSSNIHLYKIYPDSKIKILKSKGSNEVIAIPYDEKDLLSIKELNTPVIYNARIKNGDVYEFTNKSSNYITLDLIEAYEDIAYDCITYFPNSESVSLVQFDSVGWWKDVAPQQKIKLSVSKGEYLDLSVPYEFKDSVKKLSTPMFQKIEIKKGNSYEFKASKDTQTYIKDKNNDFIYDYLIYDKDGNHSSTYMDNSGWGLYINNNCTYRVAMNSKSNMEKLEFYIPYEDRITVKELNHPLIKTIILDNKNNYEIVNKTGKEYSLELDKESIGNDKKYEFILYDKNNNIKYMSTNVYSSFPCDGKVKISIVKGNNFTLYIPYDFEYELNYINNPLIFKKDILANKTYEIKNSYLEVHGVNYDEEFDVIQYGENGEIISAVHSSNYYGGDFTNIEGITKIRLTNGEKLELLLPYENRNNIKETNDLLLKKISLQKDKEYKIKNNNSFDIAVDTDIIWSPGYKITYYDSKGNVKETLEGQYEGFKIKANESVKLSVSSDYYNMYVPYEASIVDDDSTSDPAIPVVGDFNNDGKIDILDLSMLATKYNKQKGETGWDSTYDLNNDFIIDLFDLSIVAKKI